MRDTSSDAPNEQEMTSGVPWKTRRAMVSGAPLAPPLPSTVSVVRDEVARARVKFPSPDKLLAALMEEVGELAQAMLQDRPVAEVQHEASQVAAVAIRIFEEGDADFDVKNWKTNQ